MLKGRDAFLAVRTAMCTFLISQVKTVKNKVFSLVETMLYASMRKILENDHIDD